ncbi:MAG: Hpt domain-containing protein [Phycisphaerae bacterium]|jgi:HPt (histidine-containing phosphotransfer) domain-containing protein
MAAEHEDKHPLIPSSLVQDDPSLEQLVLDFLDGLRKRLDSMQDAIRDQDFASLQTAAHQLKGSGGSYGYPIITRCAAELEEHAKTAALEDCQTALARLREMSNRLAVKPDS